VSERKEELPAASLAESAKFVTLGLVPGLTRGLFKPRKRAMKVLTAADADSRAVKMLQGLRAKHGGQGVRLLGGRIVTLWGEGAIREVLDKSADVYASDGGAKGKGMAHFQPDALTLSRGEEWRDRRRFNEAVLATSERVHPFGDRFVAVVAEEVAALPATGELEWSDWEEMFDHITLRVVFGDASRDDQELTDLLAKLMNEANRIAGLSTGDDFYEFYGRLEKHAAEPGPGSLVERFKEAPQTDSTRVIHQIPHWIFAMRDTLGANAYRALAAIVADPNVEARVREELAGKDLTSAAAVDELKYLEGCLEEAMRLWPTTPLIARETTRETELAGAKLDEGTQVMILNTANHRDSEAIPDADRLKPERWQNGDGRDYRFNHLSNGSQDCPGGPLVHLIGKAALASTLASRRLTLLEPSLGASGELPNMLDFFSVRFGVERAD
jgi:cytochrome P450